MDEESTTEEKRKPSSRSKYTLPVLIVSRSATISNQVRMALKTIGYGKLSTVSSHAQGIERLRGRNFTFVIFDAKASDMSALEFVKQAYEYDDEALLIAVSRNPKIDDVFNLLRSGARGFIVHPFTTEYVEEALESAFDGPPFSEAVLLAPDRNAALAGVVLNNLYRVSVLMRQGREFSSAAAEVERFKYSFSESVELARMFCEGGDDGVLRDRIIDDCVTRAETAASRLGRTRIKLKKEREQTQGPKSKGQRKRSGK